MYQIVDLTTHTFFSICLVGLLWIFNYLLHLNRHLFGPHVETFIEKLQIFYLFKLSLKRGNRPHLVMTLFTSQLSSYTS